mmetsp:Transcript_8058/g.22376  ORF Transcript_8058/g.22376 Transcript_8058/m.22376 type:complete len:416 (-) Transcript_8058:157-1404(-)|eukprot:CAMPEP_0168730926 /NCGR_PEP_ID=MMETSP0724-20121128/6986_1 /TAXON_ID=265536 /ORGANISM="Amphiprora sp., Strain CCMP467" /LENGTH=415 /DNA_ID=CAMNT_0008777887 /DNA_START=39 /DNA_END=1286 /DNA_ORIENTATION=-
MFKTALLALLLTEAAAIAAKPEFNAASRAARKLLKNAKVVEAPARRLNQDEDEEEDYSWLNDMSLKFDGCHNTLSLSEEGGGDDGSPIQNNGVITFKLCSSKTCGSCTGGTYATNMLEFVDAFTESMMEMQEYQCEAARENCNCEDANDDDQCEQQCWYDLGMMQCIQMQDNDDAEEEFEVQRYLECAEMEDDDNNNNGYNNNGYNGYQQNGNGQYNGYEVFANWDGEYRVGPYCAADGKSIYLGVFYDEDCTMSAGDGAYGLKNYGATLPYSASSSEGPLVPLDTCVECLNQQEWDEAQAEYAEYQYEQAQKAYNGEQNDDEEAFEWNNMEPLEFCLNSYMSSAKCTSDDSSGCEFINTYLAKMSGAANKILTGSSDSKAAMVFAWVFGITTVAFAVYSVYLYRKISKGEVELN